MKRWQAGLSAALVLVLAGCGSPAGTDGDLVDDWTALGKPGPAARGSSRASSG